MVASVVAYSKNDLTISFQPTRTGSGKVSIQAIFRNDSIGSTFEKVNMQVAVPKTQRLRLEPISSTNIPVGEESSQNLRITTTIPNVQPPLSGEADVVGYCPSETQVDVYERWEGV